MANVNELVSPGELIAEGDYKAGKNTYQEENRIYASTVGLVKHTGKNVYVIGLHGFYLPSVGDLVIGKIIDMRLSGWTVDINSPYNAMLFSSDAFGRSFNPRRDTMSDFLDLGDLIVAKVNSFDRTRDPTLTLKARGLGKVTQGHVITISPAKIPRVIGRKGSMINTIKQDTDCRITIGQNGIILISGRNPELEALAIQAIHMIERDAHIEGLTDRISDFIRIEKEKMGLNVE